VAQKQSTILEQMYT